MAIDIIILLTIVILGSVGLGFFFGYWRFR